jgi:hypothetical protein
MSNWREVLSWMTPESLVGWLVKDKEDGTFGIITEYNIKDEEVYGIWYGTEEQALQNVRSFFGSWVRKNRLIPIKKVY